MGLKETESITILFTEQEISGCEVIKNRGSTAELAELSSLPEKGTGVLCPELKFIPGEGTGV